MSCSVKTVTQSAHVTKTLTRSTVAVNTVTSTVVKSNVNTMLTTDKSVVAGTQTSTFTPVTTVTVTTVATLTTAEPTLSAREAAPLEERNNQQLPPSYARNCNANQYKSACACIGVQQSTKTVTPPERTTTVTSTSTCFSTQVVQQKSTSVIFVTRTTNVNSIKTISETSTAFNTITATAPLSTATATATVTYNPADAVPTFGSGCPDTEQFFKLDTRDINNNRQFLSVDANGVLTIGMDFGGATTWTVTESGLLRQIRSSQFAVKTTGEEGLATLFGSQDLTGDVLRCSVPRLQTRVSCTQGAKTAFYYCAAEPVGSQVVLADPSAVAAGTVGQGCQLIRFTASYPCAA